MSVCALVLAALQAPGPAPERIEVRVDPRVELLAVVQLLAGYESTGLITRQAVAYKAAAREWFGPLAGHAAPRLFAEMWPEGFTFDAPVAAVLHCSPPPELRLEVEPPPELVARAGGRPRFDSFLASLRAFAAESDLGVFLAELEPTFSRCVAAARADLRGVEIELLERYFGETRAAYRIVLAPLLLPGGFGPRIARPGGRIEIYSVVGPESARDGLPDFGSAPTFRYLVWHEFSHSFVNPLLEAQPELVSATEPLFVPLAGVMRQQGYGTWLNVLQEHVVRAATVRFATLVQGEEAGRAALEEELGRSFEHVETLAGRLEDYEHARERHPALASFVPELLAPLVDEAKKRAADPAYSPPAVAASTPASGASDVDPACAEIRVEFDHDMDTTSFGFLNRGDRAFPETSGAARWTSARVCVLPVRLARGTDYWIGLNQGGVLAFRGKNGLAARPFELVFRTRP
jgi:hypothetical protein